MFCPRFIDRNPRRFFREQPKGDDHSRKTLYADVVFCRNRDCSLCSFSPQRRTAVSRVSASAGGPWQSMDSTTYVNRARSAKRFYQTRPTFFCALFFAWSNVKTSTPSRRSPTVREIQQRDCLKSLTKTLPLRVSAASLISTGRHPET